MIVQTKKRIVVTLDEEDAEQFLEDPGEVQERVRQQLYAGNGALRAATPRAVPETGSKPRKQTKPTKPKTGRRACAPKRCPECDKEMDPRALPGHREREHGVRRTKTIDSRKQESEAV